MRGPGRRRRPVIEVGAVNAVGGQKRSGSSERVRFTVVGRFGRRGGSSEA